MLDVTVMRTIQAVRGHRDCMTSLRLRRAVARRARAAARMPWPSSAIAGFRRYLSACPNSSRESRSRDSPAAERRRAALVKEKIAQPRRKILDAADLRACRETGERGGADSMRAPIEDRG